MVDLIGLPPIVIAGDSTAAGVTVPYGTTPWSDSMTRPGPIVNIAVGGSGYAALAGHLGHLDELLAYGGPTPSTVIFSGGTNDVGAGVGDSDSTATILANVSALIDAAVTAAEGLGYVVFVTTICPVGNPTNSTPYGDGFFPDPTVLDDSKAAILAINDWMRTNLGDRLIDLWPDLAGVDDWMRAEYDDFDHVHTSDEANAPIAARVDLALAPDVAPEPVVLPPRVTCLGAGTYTADIVRRRTLLGRGGPFLPGELEVVGGSWGRKANKGSAGAVTIASDPACCEAMSLIDPSANELELFRDGALVWAGPVLDVLDNRDGTVLITAQDSSRYVADERLAVPGSYVNVDVATIYAEMLQAALDLDNPGSIRFTVTPTGILGTRIVDRKDLKKLGNELDELARTGIDWTITGRTWWVGGREVPETTRLPILLRDADFASPPKIRLSRSGMATDVWVRGNGVIGHYGGARADDGVLIQTVVEESSIADQASADARARSLWDRIHEVVAIVEGGSAQLDADSPVDIQTLIPGALVPVDLGECLRFSGAMRLDSVDVSFNQTDETVAVGLQPVGSTA